MFFNKTDTDAVSPVVGVILMVAVTVILAAVIGSFVLDLGSNVSANPSAGVTFSQDAANDQVTVQVISMENADEVKLSHDGAGTFDSTSLSSVGASATYTAGADGETGQITVIGSLDGKEAVLQTFDYEV